MKKYLKVFSYLGEFKRKVYLVIILTVLEVMGTVSLPYIMSTIIDDGIKNRDVSYIVRLGLLMIAVTVLTCVVGILSSIFAAKVSSGLGDNIRIAMMEKLCDFSSPDVDYFTKASFINRMTGDVSNVQDMMSIMIGNMLSAPITIVFIIFMSVKINKSLSLIFLIAVPLFSLGSYLIVKYARPYFKKNADNLDTINRVLLEDLVNIRLIKAFVREDYMTKEYKKSAGNVKKFGLKAEQITNANNPVQQMVVNLCVISILWFGGHKIMSGSIQVGELFSFITYTDQILYQITLISMFIVPIMNSVVSVDRVLEILEKEPSVKDVSTDADKTIQDGSIVFDHVYFDYSPECAKEDMLMQDINIKIEDREAIGIVGATGSGKSTMVNLIPRLFNCSDGRIYIGGVDINDLSFKSLRDEIAFTPQKSILFSGNLKTNLLFGKKDAGEEEMVNACKEACIYDYVTSHEDGFDTHIEEGGSNVSGGQRQRLCLARAFIKDSKILVMDDCTSALDKATEKSIIDHILEDFGDRTRILISSKISSVRRMNRIVVLDKGRISGIGTHEEVLADNEIYRDLCISQGEA